MKLSELPQIAAPAGVIPAVVDGANKVFPASALATASALLDVEQAVDALELDAAERAEQVASLSASRVIAADGCGPADERPAGFAGVWLDTEDMALYAADGTEGSWEDVTPADLPRVVRVGGDLYALRPGAVEQYVTGAAFLAVKARLAEAEAEISGLKARAAAAETAAALASLCQDDGLWRYAPFSIGTDWSVYPYAEGGNYRCCVSRPMPGVCYELGRALCGHHAYFCRLDPEAPAGFSVVSSAWLNSNMMTAPADTEYDFCAFTIDRREHGGEFPAESELHFHATSIAAPAVMPYAEAVDAASLHQPNATAAEPYDIVWDTRRGTFLARRLEDGSAVYYRHWPGRGSYMTSGSPGIPRADRLYRSADGALLCIIDNQLLPLAL